MSGAMNDLSDYLPPEDESPQIPRRLSSNFGHVNNAGAFATPETYASCAAYLNQSLSMYGYPGPIVVQGDIKVEDRVTILNVIYMLLREKSAQAQIREDLTQRNQKLADDNSALTDRVALLNNEVKELEKQKWEIEMKRRLMESEFRKTETRLKTELTNIQKRCVMIQHRDNQYQHELRKSEKEYVRLQERLQRLLSERNKEGRAGMDMLNNLIGGHSKHKAPSQKAEEELFRQTVSAYEERMNDLITENTNLRKSLGNLHDELQTALAGGGDLRAISKRNDAAEQGSGDDDLAISPDLQDALDEFSPAQFDMPFDFVQSKVEGGLRAKIQVLRDKMARLQEQTRRQGNQVSAEQLRQRILEQQAIIAEQDRLIRSSLAAREDADEHDLIRQSRRWSGLEELETEKKMLRDLRSTQGSAAVELEAQRKRLEADREAFEQERQQFAQAHRASHTGNTLGAVRRPSTATNKNAAGVQPVVRRESSLSNRSHHSVHGSAHAASPPSPRRGSSGGDDLPNIRIPQTPVGIDLNSSYHDSPVQKMEIKAGGRTKTTYADDD